MKLKLKVKGSKEYYDEFLQVANTCKKVSKYPNRKVSRLTISNIKLLVVSSILFIYFMYKLLNNNASAFDYMIIGLLVMSILLIIVLIINANQRIKFYLNNESEETIITVNDSEIVFKDDFKEFNLKWDNLKCIVANKYSICFIPKELPGLVASLPIECKEDLKKILKKEKKENLLIDNTKYYD